MAEDPRDGPPAGSPPEPDADLLPLVYDELRAIAGRLLKGERRDHTLQPTAVVHEAWLRVGGAGKGDWQGRTHFVAVAARAMRRLLVDHARGRGRDKRGGDLARVTLDDRVMGGAGQELDVLGIHEALEDLAALDARQARTVELRVFGGLTVPETAEALGVARSTVDLDWSMAKAWLARRLRGEA